MEGAGLFTEQTGHFRPVSTCYHLQPLIERSLYPDSRKKITTTKWVRRKLFLSIASKASREVFQLVFQAKYITKINYINQYHKKLVQIPPALKTSTDVFFCA